nr:VOC family protein [Sphingomicrobium astaxanthinifaciens]
MRPCLWFDHEASAAAAFYVDSFPRTRLIAENRSPADWPGGKAGDVITIDLEIAGQRVMLMNGGDAFRPSPATSLMLVTRDQEETDRVWQALEAGGGAAMACGWIADRFGFAWQVTPQRLLDLLADPDSAPAAFAAMQAMVRIDIAALERAVGAPDG